MQAPGSDKEIPSTLPIGCHCNPNSIGTFNRLMLLTCKLQVVTALILLTQIISCHYNPSSISTFNGTMLNTCKLHGVTTIVPTLPHGPLWSPNPRM